MQALILAQESESHDGGQNALPEPSKSHLRAQPTMRETVLGLFLKPRVYSGQMRASNITKIWAASA